MPQNISVKHQSHVKARISFFWLGGNLCFSNFNWEANVWIWEAVLEHRYCCYFTLILLNLYKIKESKQIMYLVCYMFITLRQWQIIECQYHSQTHSLLQLSFSSTFEPLHHPHFFKFGNSNCLFCFSFPRTSPFALLARAKSLKKIFRSTLLLTFYLGAQLHILGALMNLHRGHP